MPDTPETQEAPPRESPDEVEERFREALRRALNTPPQQHDRKTPAAPRKKRESSAKKC